MGWDNPEVTFEEVPCTTGNFGNWNNDCYCKKYAFTQE
jgi:hypothetical protein